MSFWGMFAGGSNSNDLPSAGSSSKAPPSRRQQQQASSSGPPPSAASGPPPTTTAGPPPTANAYIHTPLQSPAPPHHATVGSPLPIAATAIPTFRIFTPSKSEAEQDSASEEEEEEEEEYPGNNATADVEDDDEAEIQEQVTISESGYYQTNAGGGGGGPSTYAYLPNARREQAPTAVLPTKEVEESSEDESSDDDDDDDGEKEWDWDDEEEANDEEEREPIPASTPQDTTSMQLVPAGEEQFLSNSLTTTVNDEDASALALRLINSASLSTLAKVESPSKRSRFQFLTTESIIPKLEESSTKRRHEYRTRLYEMDCQLACLEASCVEESLDRNESLRQVFPNVCRQLERTSDRFLGNKLQMDEEKDRILQLQRRVARVHGSMVQHKHETMIGCMTEDMESIGLELVQSIQPSIQMEAAKADKREGTLFRKFDSLAGTVSRRFHEESATRKAATALLEEQLAVNTMEQQFHFLEHIQTLRAGLREEREGRKERDAKVLSDVHETCSALRRAVLEAAGGANEQQAVAR